MFISYVISNSIIKLGRKMATANPHIPNPQIKFQNKLNLLEEVIKSKKLEVRKIGVAMRNLIEKKEKEIIEELDDIWEKVNTRVRRRKQEIRQKVEEIATHKKELEKLLGELNPNSKELIIVSEAIDKATNKELNVDIPYVKIVSRLKDFEESIDAVYGCEQRFMTYDNPFRLKWGKHGKVWDWENNCRPWGIATSSVNGNIYVADRDSNKIIILSNEGESIKSLKDKEIEEPENILCSVNSIYVQCSKGIVKLNSSLKKEMVKTYRYFIGGICADDSMIYVGQYSHFRINVLNLNLLQTRPIILNSRYCNKERTTCISDISLRQEVFYILLTETDYPIQAFSKDGLLTRLIVKKDLIRSADFFCLDQQLNIIVADSGDSKVKIFSNEGKLLTQFGEEGSCEGQFYGLILRGISVDELGCIVTVDCNAKNMLQAFSHPFQF